MLKIKNEDNISYKIIGEIIDEIMNAKITIYDGKHEVFGMTHKNATYIIDIKYGNRDTTIAIKLSKEQ